MTNEMLNFRCSCGCVFFVEAKQYFMTMEHPQESVGGPIELPGHRMVLACVICKAVYEFGPGTYGGRRYGGSLNA